MRKLLFSLVIISNTLSFSTVAVACNNGNSKVDISSVIKNNQLGAIKFKKDFPSLNEIIKQINIINSSSLTNSDIQFKQGSLLTNNSATIIGLNKYQGELKIEFTRLPVSNQELVNNISAVSNFQIVLTVGNNNYNNLINIITENEASFIKSYLPNYIQIDWIGTEFSLIEVDNGSGTKLTDMDLQNVTDISNAKIKFNYGTVSDASVNLQIIITSDDIVANKIAAVSTYDITLFKPINNTYQGLENVIIENNKNFILDGLTNSDQVLFESKKFNLVQIEKTDGSIITDDDLLFATGTNIPSKIRFTYGLSLEQTVDLKLKVSFK